ncbi:N-acetylmuramoyl-L-alanine amidase [Streptomyces sp. NPDC093085]|uniref:N-acetylmuramoyl-L-alanine amidase n=1 Tax=Streptomyces sp. NPDC093085 TaxID=3155068 RepID=UPI003415A77C
MSYDESPHPAPRRRFGRHHLTVAVAALVPTGLVGWLVWQGVSGPDGANATAASSSAAPASPTGPSAPTTPRTAASASASASADDDAPGGADPSGPLAGKVVVIDPGHNPGNKDHTAEINKQVSIGTTSKECDTTGTATDAGYPEAEFTLDVAHRLRTLLARQGATVRFTQDDDRPFGPCVDERARIGNEAEADAVVSVHADGSAPGNRGFHVILPALVKGGGADTSAIVGPSRELGERIVGNFVRETGSSPSNYIGDGTALDVRSDLGGLNLSTVPKVFIECGNMRDSADAALLTDPEWRQKAARGLSEGISGFLKK